MQCREHVLGPKYNLDKLEKSDDLVNIIITDGTGDRGASVNIDLSPPFSLGGTVFFIIIFNSPCNFTRFISETSSIMSRQK